MFPIFLPRLYYILTVYVGSNHYILLNVASVAFAVILLWEAIVGYWKGSQSLECHSCMQPKYFLSLAG